MTSETFEFVHVEIRNQVLIATMDDEKANALGPTMSSEVTAALDYAEQDADVKAMVLAGRSGVFSGGFDLKIIQRGDILESSAMVNAGGELVRRLYGSTVPVVAACTGHAVAAGALMLLGCDRRIGPAEDARIGLNEVAIGMTLPGWALSIANERLSRRHIQASVVNAKLYGGGAAKDAGFLDRSISADTVLEEAIVEAEGLVALDAGAYAATVRALRGPTLDRMAAQLASDRDKASEAAAATK